jgi:hypothetical protein
MVMPARTKDPTDVDYLTFDWSARLADGEAITGQSGLVDDGNPPAGAPTVDNALSDGSTVQVWLSGGTLGEDYTITCRVTTDAGRTMDWSAVLQVRQR